MMKEAKELAILILSIFGIAAASIAVPMLISLLAMKLLALMVAYPAISASSIVAFMKARRGGVSAEDAAMNVGIDTTAMVALEKIFRWLQDNFS